MPTLPHQGLLGVVAELQSPRAGPLGVHPGFNICWQAGLEDQAGTNVQLTHFDCSYCHASVAQLPVGLLRMPEAPYGRSVQPHPLQLYAFRIEPDIDRPKWMRAS